MNIIKQLVKLIKYLWNDTVSLMLLLIFIIFSVAEFINGPTPAAGIFAMAAMYVIYNVNEKGRFIEKIYEVAKSYRGLLSDLDLPLWRNRRMAVFEIIIYLIMALGSAWMMYILLTELING